MYVYVCRMKPTLLSISKLFLLAGLFVLASCTKERIKGSGTVVTETRALSNFKKILVSGSNKVHITNGNAFSVEVKGYSNLLPYFETELNGSTLDLHFRNGVSVSNNNIEVLITMPEITPLRSSGSTVADIKGPFNCENLELNISGSGDVLIEGPVVNQFWLSVSGSGNLKAFGMVAVDADVDISGEGKTELTVTGHLKVDISGSAVVYYKGTPTVESNISGSGKLISR